MIKRHTLSIIIAVVFAAAPLAAQESSTMVGGYGELHYNEPEGGAKGQLDFHRFVIYLNHEFNDWIGFYSETEIEHTYVSNSERSGELSIEQALLEFRPWQNYGFRAGIMLPPVGIINLIHEPPTFHGVERPNFHRHIIPTTWREAGIGFYGAPLHNLQFQVYAVSSFTAGGLSAGSGLRGGRQKAIRSSTADMGVTGRVDYMPVLGLNLGASFFTGGVGHGTPTLDDAGVTMLAADARYSVGHLQLRAEGAMVSISDAEAINALYDNMVADRFNGWYAEAAYNVLPFFSGTLQQLFVFGRYEMYDTQAETTGFDPIEAFDRTDITIGLTYKPDVNVAVKLDYQLFDDARDLDGRGQLNAGIGYAFF